MLAMAQPSEPPLAPDSRSRVSVLVVDDSRAQRRILTVQLKRWGYEVTEAEDGEAALHLCRNRSFDIVLSDWMMPGMTGLDLCQAFRALPKEGYGYFILLTSKSEKTEIAVGLENGADDFLTKPVNSDELRARLRAGERIVSMQQELVEKNRLVGSTLDQLQKVYDSLDRDLIEAHKLQQALVRDRVKRFQGGTANVLLRPSGHVGGDLVGSFRIDSRRVAIFSVDVSGHGVASGMMTARLAGMFSSRAGDQNIALNVNAYGQPDSWPPEIVAFRLNQIMIEEMQVDQYFTMAYADINLNSGQVDFVQAGHPHPVLIRADGSLQPLGEGGMPIGLIPGAKYVRCSVVLHPGDRLFLTSDGITECPDLQGNELGGEGLLTLLSRSISLPSSELLEALIWDLSAYAGGKDFPDDVSGVMFDFTGQG